MWQEEGADKQEVFQEFFLGQQADREQYSKYYQ